MWVCEHVCEWGWGCECGVCVHVGVVGVVGVRTCRATYSTYVRTYMCVCVRQLVRSAGIWLNSCNGTRPSFVRTNLGSWPNNLQRTQINFLSTFHRVSSSSALSVTVTWNGGVRLTTSCCLCLINYGAPSPVRRQTVSYSNKFYLLVKNTVRCCIQGEGLYTVWGGGGGLCTVTSLTLNCACSYLLQSNRAKHRGQFRQSIRYLRLAVKCSSAVFVFGTATVIVVIIAGIVTAVEISQ